MDTETQARPVPTEEDFNQCFSNIVANGIYTRINNMTININDFLSTLRNEMPSILANLEELEKSNASVNFISYIKSCLSYGTQSAGWYYVKEEESASVSLACAAPETYLETSSKYLIAREWLNELKSIGMI